MSNLWQNMECTLDTLRDVDANHAGRLAGGGEPRGRRPSGLMTRGTVR